MMDDEEDGQRSPLLRVIEDDSVDVDTWRLSLLIGTWNMHGRPKPETSLKDIFFPHDHDLYVIATQECERSIETSVVFPSDHKPWKRKLQEEIGSEYIIVAR